MNSPTLASGKPDTSHRQVVAVRAPGRLHLGFLDPAGTLGRRFGSLGLVIDGFDTHVEIGPALVNTVDATSGPGACGAAERDRAAAHLASLQQHTGRSQPLHLRLRQWPPAHAGLGSGTQLALAIGRAFAAWHGLNLATPTLAAWLGRGLRSGVGIAGFDQGGLLLDGGPGAPGHSAPLLARMALPEAWRVILLLDPRLQGLSGADEKLALASLPPLPQASSAELCHQVLMQILPGAADGQFAPFASGISRLQQILGAHFAPAQQGRAYTSADIGHALQWMAGAAGDGGQGGAAIGQSSWGPTGFAILPTQVAAEALLRDARAAGVLAPELALHIVRGRNHGAVLGPAMAAAVLPSAAH
jgi:beta-RFAP synthase